MDLYFENVLEIIDHAGTFGIPFPTYCVMLSVYTYYNLTFKIYTH